MDWQPGGMSDDVEDRRGESGGGGGFGFGGMGGGLGLGGFVILLIISVITGRNYIGQFLGGGNVQTQQVQRAEPGGPVQQTPEEKRSAELISYVLDDAQKTWTNIFAENGKQYRHAKLVLFRDSTYSGCGDAESSTGPFYCPADGKVYIDLGFWEELQRFGGGTSDFAQAYVVTHEIGHHIQNLLGTERAARNAVQRGGAAARSQVSVALELQADCYAGVWAHSPAHPGTIHDSDISAGLKAAAAVGDDHLQKMAGRAVSPERFTHGSSAQRQQWFERGYQSGNLAACNTFKQSSEEDSQSY